MSDIALFATTGPTGSSGDVPAVTISSLLTSIGSIFTTAIGWVGKVAETIAGEPILLIACVGIPLCGLGIGMFKRLLSARA